ncbi:tripartite tricarboxylate transporter permease [Vibrio lentus]|nr:tripartite tricarboxylate transporter permease [Vibrio lentus]
MNAPGCFNSSNRVRRLPNGTQKEGQAGKALALAAYSSFTGGTPSAIMLLIAAPALASVSLSFQSSDYFARCC